MAHALSIAEYAGTIEIPVVPLGAAHLGMAHAAILGKVQSRARVFVSLLNPIASRPVADLYSLESYDQGGAAALRQRAVQSAATRYAVRDGQLVDLPAGEQGANVWHLTDTSEKLMAVAASVHVP